MTGEDFNHTVIGSSPMMLMQARELALSGQSVCVLEKNAQLGGAWEVARVGESGKVEIASHVIEVFPGVYEYLQEASGAEFVVLDAQPIRMSRKGGQVPYFSRLLLLAAGLRMVVGYIIALAESVLGRSADSNDLINYRTKLRSFLRYQLRYLVRSAPMMGPKNGFVDFIEKLERRCRETGVSFRQFDVAQVSSSNGLWHLEDSAGQRVTSTQVHMTTSCGLKKAQSGTYKVTPRETHERAAMVVDIDSSDVPVSQTYVAFWKDPKVSRISRIDMPGDTRTSQRFLIEFRERTQLEAEDTQDIVRGRLTASDILAKGAAYDVVGPVVCIAVQNTDQLPLGELEPGLHAYYSNGNLAAGMAHWMAHQRPRKHLGAH